MTPFDYSTPPPQTALNLIPAKAIMPVIMNIKPGGSGEDGWPAQQDRRMRNARVHAHRAVR